jgi:protein-S-isoprenylcysteine O-methyltransferase Ste14
MKETVMADIKTAAPVDNPGIVAWPPVLHAAAFLVVLALDWIWPWPIFDRPAYRWAGLPLIVIGISIVIWGRITMLAAGTNINPSQPAVALVTSGPFRFSRNPLYTALMLVFSGLTLAFNTWWGFAMLIPVFIVMFQGVIRREERYLERKFGDSYRDYCAHVRRYV